MAENVFSSVRAGGKGKAATRNQHPRAAGMRPSRFSRRVPASHINRSRHPRGGVRYTRPGPFQLCAPLIALICRSRYGRAFAAGVPARASRSASRAPPAGASRGTNYTTRVCVFCCYLWPLASVAHSLGVCAFTLRQVFAQQPRPEDANCATDAGAAPDAGFEAVDDATVDPTNRCPKWLTAYIKTNDLKARFSGVGKDWIFRSATPIGAIVSLEAYRGMTIKFFDPWASYGHLAEYPCCPRCNKAGDISRQGWQSKGPRRVMDVQECFWVQSRSFQCSACQRNHLPYNFLSTHPGCLAQVRVTCVDAQHRLTCLDLTRCLCHVQLAVSSPGILHALDMIGTKRLAVSSAMLKKCRYAMMTGHSFESLSNEFGELHHQRFYERRLAYTTDSMQWAKNCPPLVQPTSPPPLFGIFSDMQGYAGCYPSASYLVRGSRFHFPQSTLPCCALSAAWVPAEEPRVERHGVEALTFHHSAHDGHRRDQLPRRLVQTRQVLELRDVPYQPVQVHVQRDERDRPDHQRRHVC